MVIPGVYMLSDYTTLQNPLLKGVKSINDRPPPSLDDLRLPAGLEVVSADDHWSVTEDIFYESFPPHLRDRAPRIWHDGFWRIGKPGGKQVWSSDPKIQNAVMTANLRTAWTHDMRRHHLAAEGITKEIVFPQSLLGYSEPDPEVREWIYWTYNTYIAEQGRKNSSFFGMGLFSNWWDEAKVERSMDQIVRLGLKGFLMLVNLKGSDNTEVSYADPALDRFWAVASEAGLPVCFHIGEPFTSSGRGAMAYHTLVAMAPFRKPISQIVFGGVLDRHPNLQIVFAEGGIGWVLPWLQDAEAMYDTYSELVERPKCRPSHYWRTNCAATFQADALGLSRLDVLGADRVLWASDYPHTEGTYGFSAAVMKSIVDQVGEADARLILGGNAKRIFRI
jgi:predicted TIM-barrel fold metal-dependent hydrolase